MLNHFEERKETFLTIKKRVFLSPKNALFQRGQPMLLVKKCHFFLYLDLVKIRLEIMLNHFEERKETFFDYKKEKQNFSKFKKSHFFPKGLIHAFGLKMPFFSLFRFDQNKTGSNAF